jgi:hypothetical protein
MGYLSRFSPFRAVRDLRFFLSQRHPYELGFFALAVVATTLIIAGFVHDSHEEKVYKREIIYVQNWRADRSDAEIAAQLKIDAPKEAAAKAEQKRREDERRAMFKKMDDKLTKWGL